jgi:deoxycytidine triphosphate deaminase
MILADKDIRKAVENGDITISDFDESRLQPASYDILLGNKFIINDANSTQFIDPVNKIYAKTHEVEIPDDGTFVLTSWYQRTWNFL